MGPPTSDQPTEVGDLGSRRLDPGLVELVKALARSSAARDIAAARSRKSSNEDPDIRPLL